MKTLFRPKMDELEELISNEKIDLVFYGLNGDIRYDKTLADLRETRLKHIPSGYFKHLCGEYDTSSSFALWLATQILKKQVFPKEIAPDKTIPEKVDNILIINNTRNNNYSLIHVSTC
ncbi:MAG: hypothetical protein HC906_00970 [Bacteroidales bacterium]|nr:hypothetical protein [Bacteroidales bacterium]